MGGSIRAVSDSHRTSFGIGRVAALVPIVDPAVNLLIDPGRAAAALGLTRRKAKWRRPWPEAPR